MSTDHFPSSKALLNNILEDSLTVHANTVKDLKETNFIDMAVKTTVNCLLNKGKLLFAGNGGSAADAQHMSGEYVSRFLLDRSALPAIALTTDTSVITAIGNDYGYETIFTRQVEALGCKDDVLFLYKTSGNSMNVVNAARSARKKDIVVIGFTGRTRGQLTSVCDLVFHVPSLSVPRVQEMHHLIGHIICELVEKQIVQDS